MNNNMVKTFLSFFWFLPFLYIFLDIYFNLDLKLSAGALKTLLVISTICALILVVIWFKEFKESSYKSNAFKAIRETNIGKLESILNRAPTPNIYTNDAGKTLLEYAIDEQVDSSIIYLLLSNKCYVSRAPSAEYNLGFTLFYLCAYYNYINNSIIKYLLDAGANINFADTSKGFEGLSILQSLTLRGDKEAIALALEHGANISYFVNDLSLNTLMLAAKYIDDPIIIKMLLEYGANVSEVNKDGYNALLLAAQYNSSSAVITTLVNAGAKLRNYHIKSSILKYNDVTALILASTYNNESVVRKLISLGDDIEFKDSLGLNALFVAAAHNPNVDVIKALLMAGLSLEKTRDKDGNTPLMAAAFLNSNPTVIKYLIDKTHNLKSINNDGFNFIDYLKQNHNLSEAEKDTILNRWS
ncbi:MAG: ankyrin repeat domain-containing protein [Alphaproteobacteria bacterium]|jgi:ankyrin repeat protein|nr:ankyrin repeat domain-containing protein [Alphaproteobacteria bacterium]